MKSVGEVMAIGRTFKQAFAKAMRSRELDIKPRFPTDQESLLRASLPGADRIGSGRCDWPGSSLLITMKEPNATPPNTAASATANRFLDFEF